MIAHLIKRFALRLIKNKTTRFSPAHVQDAFGQQEFAAYQNLADKIDLTRCYYDEMYQRDGTHYLKVGLSAIKNINEAVSTSHTNEITQVLDMPCGYGRVLRFLNKFYPAAEITACDLNRHAVDFCTKQFGATPVYSSTDLDHFSIGKTFDLVWCGSLATHLDASQTESLLRFFYRHLNSGGILIFSMHGKKALHNLESRAYTYVLPEDRIEKILKETASTGYGYANYKRTSAYGISACTEEWMKKALERAGNWRNYRFAETAWDNHHDIYSVVKV